MREARSYLRRGWRVVPLARRSKRPTSSAWQRLELGEADLAGAFHQGGNVGLLLGEPSGGLVDVDLDCPEAVELAAELLPRTGMVHGRVSAPRSHYWYRATPAPPRTVRYKHPRTGDTLVELRSTGGQTVVPPSVHPCGEPLRWEEEGSPLAIRAAELERHVARLACAALLTQEGWPLERVRAWLAAPSPGPGVPGEALEWIGAGRPPAGIVDRTTTTARTQAIYDRADVPRVLSLLGVEFHGERTTCPIKRHRKARDSFTWKGKPDAWHCHACERGGNVVSLVEAVRGCSYVEAREWLEERLGLAPGPVVPSSAETGATAPAEESAQPGGPAYVWEEPVPISGAPLPAFPVEELPTWLAAWVRAEAEETQTPADMAAFLALGALACASARKWEVHVRGQWREPLNLYTLVVSPPGTRKSAVFGHATDPLAEWERVAREDRRAAVRLAEERVRRLNKRAERKRAEAEREEDDETAEAKLEEVVALEERARDARRDMPARCRLLWADITMERLVGVMADHGGRAGIFSAEGTLFEVAAGRYSGGAANIEALLHSHTGEDVRVDRMGRSELVRRPALTVALAVQPDVLESLSKQRAFTGRGLVARFLFCVPPSNVGAREVAPAVMLPHVRGEYARRLEAVLDAPLPSEPERLTLEPDALAALDTYAEEVERSLAPGGRLANLKAWGGKLLGATVRLAGLFHVATAGGRVGPRVGVESMKRAIRLGPYLLAHAEAAHRLIGTSPAHGDAEAALEWIRAGALGTFTRRELQRSSRRWRSAEQAQAALDLLEDHGWVRQATAPGSGGRRGRPSLSPYFSHPRLITNE